MFSSLVLAPQKPVTISITFGKSSAGRADEIVRQFGNRRPPKSPEWNRNHRKITGNVLGLFSVALGCHDARMETESYWRTRTIAEAQSQGYSHVRVTCSGCGRITDIPWNPLLRSPRITTATFIGNVPLKCQRCGSTEPLIGVQQHGNVQGGFGAL